ncbi:hypothetical protein, partial [Microvirga sp. KLBC 81]|uniref:hypothetical protein n=1 Tax=Microvirga sp. KLBC 81 TaxID=1862707 RepID=UPI00197C1922
YSLLPNSHDTRTQAGAPNTTRQGSPTTINRQDIRGTHRRQVFHRQALPQVLKGAIALLRREYSDLDDRAQ